MLENQASLETELLSRELALSPTGFEDLVIRLLETMGYGRAGNVHRTSVSGDAGIDGIISHAPSARTASTFKPSDTPSNAP